MNLENQLAILAYYDGVHAAMKEYSTLKSNTTLDDRYKDYKVLYKQPASKFDIPDNIEVPIFNKLYDPLITDIRNYIFNTFSLSVSRVRITWCMGKLFKSIYKYGDYVFKEIFNKVHNDDNYLNSLMHRVEEFTYMNNIRFHSYCIHTKSFNEHGSRDSYKKVIEYFQSESAKQYIDLLTDKRLMNHRWSSVLFTNDAKTFFETFPI